MTETRSLTRLLGVVAISVAAIGLSGCSVLNTLTNSTERDADGNVTESNADADVFSVQVGDCFNDSEANSDGTVSEVPIVPCSDAHSYEAYKSIIVDEGDGSYPGEDTVTAQADADCVAAFAEFVGIDFNSSTLSYTYFYPTEDTWTELGDREILCMIVDPNGQVTGSLEGAAR